jgi:transposase
MDLGLQGKHAIVTDPGRFGTSKALGAHLGLAPRVYQSGEIDRSSAPILALPLVAQKAEVYCRP